MSQRWLPPRDRSPPPRPFDRRASSTFTPVQSQSYRPTDSGPSSADRGPPRGPRAESFRGGYASTPRGRGGSFVPRGGDSWDRDRDRDPRVQSNTFRRDDDRSDWPRRDERPAFRGDRSYVGNQPRERSASPRARRDSKEAITTPYNRGPESAFGSSIRGGSDRGRGRGGWDSRRGRSSFIGDRERELFPNRSRSREGWRDREFDRPRNFGAETDRVDRFDRRDYDRGIEREPRPRDHDVWPRDPSPGRSSTGGRGTSPGALSSISQDRKFDHDLLRKPLTTSNLQNREVRRETDDYFGPRTDMQRREPQPPPAPQPSASLGLDYGPPPSAPATAPPPSAAAPTPVERQFQPTKPAKPEPIPAPSPFQPPSGPKADRSSQAPGISNLQRHAAHQHDARSKFESATRLSPEVTKDALVEPPRALVADSRSERSTSTPAQGDRQMPPHVPSGPRLSASMPYKPKLSPMAQHTSLPPAQPKALANEGRNIPNVPTGPRSSSILPPSGPRANVPTGPAGTSAGPGTTWRRPQVEFRPQKPSIMGGMNRSQMLERSIPAAPPASKRSPTIMSRQMSGGGKLSQSAIAGSVRATSPMTDVKQEPAPAIDVEMSAPASEEESEDDDDDEPESELDENYYEDSEKMHAKELDRLKSQIPPPILEDPAVVRLLIRIQLLGMIAEGLVPDGIHTAGVTADVEMTDEAREGLPSPDESPQNKQSPALEHPRPRGRPLKEAPVNPIPTPPIEDLPYLRPQSGETVSFDEPSEDDVEEEKMTILLRNQFEQEAWEEKDDRLELSEFYKQKFPEWKYEIDKFERMKRDIEGTPDPGSPGAHSVASVPQSVEKLTGRAARNATDFDIEKAILMSQQSAREEEERREREAAQNAVPNYETEAVVPDMLKPTARDSTWKFQDTNRIVPTDLAVNLMQYIPPEDDFTPEEQAKFITAFCQTPKKWGQIADQIPSRSYQECILHYYLTKMDANYKELWRRAQPKKRGRRTATKARANALMSDLALNEDPENAPLPMTDSGRPRRAAAPTFGDTPDVEATNLPAAKRLAATPKDTTETPAPKPKGRKAGVAAKPRRKKAQIEADKLAAQSLAAQVNADGSPVKGRARTLMRAEPPKADPHMPLATVIDASQLLSGQPAVSAAQMRARSPSVPTVTSYWSVPEQQKFRQLVAYYGRDYAKIADFMKTKSQAMIKNHYSREVGKGDTELEQFAQIAEDKIARGEPLGRLPSPVAPAKRKYDPMPPIAASGRPLPGTGEVLLDTDRPLPAAKASVIDDFPANAIHRDLSGSLVAKASPRDALLQHNSPHIMPVQPKLEDYNRDRDRPLLAQKSTMSGPPIGRFTDDPLWKDPYRGLTTAPDPVPHHHPPTLVELGGEMSPAERRAVYERELNERRHPIGAPRIGWDAQLPSDIPREPYQSHSRNTSNAGLSTTLAEQRNSDILRMTERSRYGLNTTQSPRAQPLQSVARDNFLAFGAPSHSLYQPQQRSPVKQEPPKPVPAKRSAILDLLNTDEPERPAKRSSTDSARPSMQTPPPQHVMQSQQLLQPVYGSRMPEDLLQRSAMYNGGAQHVNDMRGSYSNSPAPSRSGESWMDRFDPRLPLTDRASNQSPLHAMPPASSAGRSIGDGLRALDGPSRFIDLRRDQIPSPSRQIATPLQQARSATAVPQQHSRISSSNFDQFGPDPLRHDYRSMQTQQQQPQYGQQPQIQPAVTHAQSASGTPVSSLHTRGQPSQDFDPRDPRRQTIQEYKRSSDYQRDPRDMGIDVRPFREDLTPRGQEAQHRSIAPPPQHESLRTVPDRNEMYRPEPSHRVPPPPRGTNLSQLNASYGAPPSRSYNNTPPAYGEPRTMASSHNQHAHHHHHSLSSQGTPQHQHPQGHGLNLAPQPQSHQNIAPAHHQQPPYTQASSQSYRDQPRFGQQQPLSMHYRNYSQGGDDRR